MHGDRGMRVPPQPVRTAGRHGPSSRPRRPASSLLASPWRSVSAWSRCSSHSGGALAWQGMTPEQELAARFAPIIILQRQDFPCDPDGEPYLPAPVDVVFADEAVVLRQGPQQEPVTSPVENADLFALPDDFATDFPGKPRTPGCDYETHFKAVMGDQRPVIYAHDRHRRGAARHRAAVLVLLLLQRLQQPARRRLGDDPAPLRRRQRRGGARSGAGRGRVRPAQRGRDRRLGRPEAGARGNPPGRLRLERVARLLLRPRSLARLGAGRLRARLRRHQRRPGPHRPGGAPHSRRPSPERTTPSPG